MIEKQRKKFSSQGKSLKSGKTIKWKNYKVEKL